MSKIKLGNASSEDALPRMELEDFMRLGFLQEANRLFFHPRGMALLLLRHDDGRIEFGGILDAREDPEGYAFASLDSGKHRAADMYVRAELARHREARCKLFGGYHIQPIGHSFEKKDTE